MQEQKISDCYVVRKRADLTDGEERYAVIDKDARSVFLLELPFTGSKEQCQDFAYLMNMARSGRFLVVA